MAERLKIDVEAFINAKTSFKLETAEPADERASRLRREESEEVHKLRIELIVTIFAMTVLGIAFLACASIAAAVGGSLTGKKSKS